LGPRIGFIVSAADVCVAAAKMDSALAGVLEDFKVTTIVKLRTAANEELAAQRSELSRCKEALDQRAKALDKREQDLQRRERTLKEPLEPGSPTLRQHLPATPTPSRATQRARTNALVELPDQPQEPALESALEPHVTPNPPGHPRLVQVMPPCKEEEDEEQAAGQAVTEALSEGATAPSSAKSPRESLVAGSASKLRAMFEQKAAEHLSDGTPRSTLRPPRSSLESECVLDGGINFRTLEAPFRRGSTLSQQPRPKKLTLAELLKQDEERCICD